MIEAADHHTSLKRFAEEMRQNSGWMMEALCATPEYKDHPWFPEQEASLSYKHNTRIVLKKICACCPVQAECKTFAKKAGVSAGIWAGHYYGA